jgi:hypothetical protein
MKESDWKKKKRKREEEWRERYERDESSKRKKIKCEEGYHIVERWNFHSFSNHVQSDSEDVVGA